MKYADPLCTQLIATIDREQLLGSPPVRARQILIALSGGADSTVLLHLLAGLRHHYKVRLVAAHVNHGLGPPRRLTAEEAHCRVLCRRIGIDLVLHEVPVRTFAQRQKLSIETAARALRYAALTQIADATGCDRIATAHHADDQIETVFFRLSRGGWLDSLAGIPYRRDNIIRPLLDCRREEIRRYLRRHRISVVHDETNDSDLPTRNRIRHKVLPVLRTYVPDLASSFLELARQSREVSELIAAQLAGFHRSSVHRTPGGKLLVDSAAVQALPSYVRSLALRDIAANSGSFFRSISPVHVAMIEQVATGERSAANLPQGLTVRLVSGLFGGKREGAFLLFSIPRPSQAPVLLDLSKQKNASVTLYDGAATLTGDLSGRKGIPRAANSVRIDAARIEPPLTVRSWRPGDRFVPLGMSGSKKVGDYLTDKKVPGPLRDEQLVATDGQGIIWLVGQTIADRVQQTADTTRTLTLTVHPGKIA